MRPSRFSPTLAVLLAALFALWRSVPAPGAEPDPEPAWGAASGADPCGSETKLEELLAADPALAERRELFEALVREAERQGLVGLQSTAAGNSYVIPVAVHIVHQGGAENISDNQVLSQIYALNRDAANSPGNPAPAVNTGIQFCLAQNLPPASPVTWSTTPGITRTSSPQTNHIFNNQASEIALKAIDYLPSDKYLNIWVVKTISGGGVAGYATFPGTVPQTIDGIVMRYDAFGSNYTPYGGPYTLLPSNDDGKILTHEVGHFLNLYHTFHMGCAPPGDQVTDTPPEAVNRTGCPVSSLASCTQVNDPIQNFMDYTNDPCRFAFTGGQATRMQTAIAQYRSTLVSAQNLIAVGCPSGLNALIVASPAQLCAGASVAFTTPASGAGYTYAWSFPGGAPSSAATQNATVTYPAAGVWPVTLTVTDGGPNSSTNTRQVYVKACTPILGPCTNWTFPAGAALSWATGAPVPVSGTQVFGAECASMISNSSGNLILHTDGDGLWDANNNVTPNGTGLLAGGSSHYGAIFVPRPGSSTQYFLFTVRMWEYNNTPDPMNYSVIDMTLNGGMGDIVSGQKNLPVSLPGSPVMLVEGMALIPHCNGTDWWLISHGAWNMPSTIYVTLVTAAGPVATLTSNTGLNVPSGASGAIVPSADGTRVAMIAVASYSVAAYTFNRATGAIGPLYPPTSVNASTDVAFSPNGNLLYYTYLQSGATKLRQLDLTTLQTREILTSPYFLTLRPGPDGLLYLAERYSTTLHCINYPDTFNTLNQNECGLNLNSVPLPAGTQTSLFGGLPNSALQCTSTQPALFNYKITNCLTVNFSSPTCTGPYTWNFGDASGGSGQNVSHTYAAPGTYTVTLNVPGAVPPTAQKQVTLGMAPVTIAGSNTVCGNPYNYSAVGPPGYTYSWSVSGGTPVFASGNFVDITWGAGGGTVQLVATDSTTGCTATVVKQVGPCPVCVSPPLNMTAWYPLDEPSGLTAWETVLGANASDMNAPAHAPAKVRRGRSFNGVNQRLEANDAPGLNFGTGDITIDAWVRTTAATGIQPIVDKRYVDPELGYALYLQNGRLGFRLGDGTVASQYWTNTSAFVADGQWHHVAGVLQRSGAGNGTRLYVDGIGVASFPPFTGGSVTNTEKLLIGAEAGYFGPQGYLNGDLDEVEFFQRALAAADLQAMCLADTMGKCKEYSWVPTVANICRDQTEITLTMQVCNYTTAPQTYNVSFTGLSMGGSCTWNGPAIQMLTSNPVSVPAASCVPVQYKVFRPPGMPIYTNSCYQVTVTNTATSTSTVNVGSVYASRRWCNLTISTDVGLGTTTSSATLRFRATNTSEEPLVMPYAVSVLPAPGQPEAPGVGLNGLVPDVPLTGDFTLGPGESADLEVAAQFTEPRSFRFYDVVLAVDEDGDGTADAQTSAGLTYGRAGTTVSVPPAVTPPVRLRLLVLPNPVRGQAEARFELPEAGVVEFRLFDVAGRQVRVLPRAAHEAGPGTVSLDTRGLARGVYFLRMQANGESVGRRFVLVE